MSLPSCCESYESATPKEAHRPPHLQRVVTEDYSPVEPSATAGQEANSTSNARPVVGSGLGNRVPSPAAANGLPLQSPLPGSPRKIQRNPRIVHPASPFHPMPLTEDMRRFSSAIVGGGETNSIGAAVGGKASSSPARPSNFTQPPTGPPPSTAAQGASEPIAVPQPHHYGGSIGLEQAPHSHPDSHHPSGTKSSDRVLSPRTRDALASIDQLETDDDEQYLYEGYSAPRDEWEFDPNSGFYWSRRQGLFWDEDAHLMYDPHTCFWYDPATDEWFTVDD